MSEILLRRKRWAQFLLKSLLIHFLFTFCLIEFIRRLIAFSLPPRLWSFHAAAEKSPGEKKGRTTWMYAPSLQRLRECRAHWESWPRYEHLPPRGWPAAMLYLQPAGAPRCGTDNPPCRTPAPALNRNYPAAFHAHHIWRSQLWNSRSQATVAAFWMVGGTRLGGPRRIERAPQHLNHPQRLRKRPDNQTHQAAGGAEALSRRHPLARSAGRNTIHRRCPADGAWAAAAVLPITRRELGPAGG